MAQERMVTRKVIGVKTYKVYKMDGLQLVELEEIETKGKIKEAELAKKHDVDKVVVVCTGEKKITYGMTVSDFMEYAHVIEDEAETETETETIEE